MGTLSPVVSESQLLATLGERYAVKKFDAARKIPAATWKTLESALVLSPSSYGLQPWKFVVVTNPDLRAKLRAASWNQGQITDASHLVVFCQRTSMSEADVNRYIDRVVEVRKAPRESLEDYRKMMVGSVSNPSGLPGGSVLTYTRSQTYIALGVFLSACAMLGVDACPMEGFDAAQYAKILGMKGTGYAPVVLATAGYRASDDWLANLAKVRFDERDVIDRRV